MVAQLIQSIFTQAFVGDHDADSTSGDVIKTLDLQTKCKFKTWKLFQSAQNVVQNPKEKYYLLIGKKTRKTLKNQNMFK